MKSKQNLSSKGVHILTLCDITNPKGHLYEEKIEQIRQKRTFLIETQQATPRLLKDLWDEYQYWISLLHKMFKSREFVIENITTTVGRSVLAQRLAGTTTYSGTVNYTALGNDNTAPAVGDATLGNETYRKALSSGTYSNNIAYIETFFTAAEVNGTFEEYGNFIDGTGSADTGQLFNRFTSTVTKSSTETLNVQSIITFNDA